MQHERLIRLEAIALVLATVIVLALVAGTVWVAINDDHQAVAPALMALTTTMATGLLGILSKVFRVTDSGKC